MSLNTANRRRKFRIPKAAWITLGVVLLAIANSLSKSINGKSLWSRVKESANRKEPLEDRVRTHLSEGMTMEEIQAMLSEDVEDLVMEAQAARPVTE